MLLTLEIINMCIYTLKNVKYVKIYKIGLLICYQDFMNQIDIILRRNSAERNKYAKSQTYCLYLLYI